MSISYLSLTLDLSAYIILFKLIACLVVQLYCLIWNAFVHWDHIKYGYGMWVMAITCSTLPCSVPPYPPTQLSQARQWRTERSNMKQYEALEGWQWGDYHAVVSVASWWRLRWCGVVWCILHYEVIAFCSIRHHILMFSTTCLHPVSRDSSILYSFFRRNLVIWL